MDDREADLFSLPTRLGGLGVRDPVWLSTCSFQASRMGCGKIVEFMRSGDQLGIIINYGRIQLCSEKQS